MSSSPRDQLGAPAPSRRAGVRRAVLLGLGPGLGLAACGPVTDLELGDFLVSVDERAGSLTVRHEITGAELRDVRLFAGHGSAEVAMQLGAFSFDEVTLDLVAGAGFSGVRRRFGPPWVIRVEDGDGDEMGVLTLGGVGEALALGFTPARDVAPSGETNRTGFSAACERDDHFLGLGSHAFDVDHVGEAFALWTSEPGIGKSETETPPPDWPIGGTRHGTSFPSPVLVRPQLGQALVLDQSARVDVDLCATSDRFELVSWSAEAAILLHASGSALGAVESMSGTLGRLELPPPWVFAPWNDAVRGRAEVERVAALLRDLGASTSVIWTEDWKGAEQTPLGYHLTGEWTVDERLYPEPEGLAADLERRGFAWFAYFSPFVYQGTDAWDDAFAADVLIRDPDGEVLSFDGATLQPTSLVDLTGAPGRDWVGGHLRAALDLGFDGWMADFAEWLPAGAAMSDGRSGLDAHNAYPELWQEANADVVRGEDATFFARSGWTRTPGLAPVVWAGDQRTSFDADDGLPTVLPLGLGSSACGVPVFTHDVAGYQSLGNPPADKELWFRWASLGAYTPIFRTHHGAFDTENWSFDSDEETLAHYLAVTDAHMRLFPYRYGLAGRAARQGTPMVLPVAFVFGEDWARTDAWMLGTSMLVAPVVERGVTGRAVELPEEVRWWTWPGLEPAVSGWFDAAIDQIPVFVPEGSVIPTWSTIPDTLLDGADPGLVGLAEADASRVVYVFGAGGEFVEADDTRYRVRGAAEAGGERTVTLTSGEVEVGGLRVEIRGPVERVYTIVSVR